MPVRAILFDLDDTLVDFQGAIPQIVAALTTAVCQRYPHLDPATVRQILSPGTLSVQGYVERLARLGVEDPALAADLVTVYRQARRAAVRLFPEARAVLQTLHGWRPLVLVSNGRRCTRRDTLSALELEPFFTTVIISEEVGVEKPDPRIFALALAACGVAPAEAVHIGDDPLADVLGAQRAGLRAVWLNRAGRPQPSDLPAPDLIARDLREVLAWLIQNGASPERPCG